MTILVRERPPLRLSASVQTPTGSSFRWAQDEHDAGNKPQSLTFSTGMPGGFNQASLTLERNPRLSYADLEELSTITIYGAGGQVAWQGRIEDLPSTYDPSSAGFNPQAVGFQAHLDDDDSASMVYIDRDMTTWAGPGVQRQVNLLTLGLNLSNWSEQVGSDTAGSPAICFQAVASSLEGISEIWYDSGALNLISQLRIQAENSPALPLTNAAAVFNVASSSDDVGSSIDQVALAPAGTSTLTAIVENLTAYRYFYIDMGWGATSSGNTTEFYYLENIAVVGNHGLTIRDGASGVSPGVDDGLLASDIMAHAVGTWCPLISYSTGSSGTIIPSSFVIPQMVFNTPTTSSAIIKQAAQYELLDWAVWEGPTFWANPRGQYANARSWRARVGPTQLQATGPQSSRLYNGVVVAWTNVDGTNGVIGPAQNSLLLDTDPQNPANQVSGLKRYALLQMTGTSTSAAAIQTGQIFLQEQKLLDTSGQATLTGHVQDDSGVWWPSWAVRAGDSIMFIDASDTSSRRIISTSYDDTSKANSIQLDQPPDGMSALLARLSVVLSPLGLS